MEPLPRFTGLAASDCRPILAVLLALTGKVAMRYDSACNALLWCGWLCGYDPGWNVLLASFLAPVDQAESDLIAAYRRVRDLSGGKPEPTAAWSVIIGLIAVFADQAESKEPQALIDPLSEWLKDRCGEIRMDAKLAGVVKKNFAKHWRSFHGPAGDLAALIATRLLQETQ